MLDEKLKELELAGEEAQKVLREIGPNDLTFRLKAAETLALIGIGKSLEKIAREME